ncbi:hypothetical protein BDD12DRAFT_823791 [Trichophaea hybrida]|nr:hypothetical protein BDD12DRAFT_823791 [Trichophaea hybrida]
MVSRTILNNPTHIEHNATVRCFPNIQNLQSPPSPKSPRQDMVSSLGEFDKIRILISKSQWEVDTSTTSRIMGSSLSRRRIEPAVPFMSYSRGSASATERSRRSTASSESDGRAPDNATAMKSDCDEGARRPREPNRVTTMRERFEDLRHEAAPCHESHPERLTRAEAKENRTSQQDLEAGDGHSKGRSVPADPSSRGVDRDITTRVTEPHSGKSSVSDETAKWKGKYYALKEENQTKYEKLHRSNEKLKEAYEKARKDLDDEKQLAYNTTQRLQGELQHHKSELEELHTSHIRSVNDVGTGLQHISDQEFQKRIRSLHDEGGGWCRRAFKQRTVQDIKPQGVLDEHLLAIILPRVVLHAKPTFAQIIEMVVWGFVEDHIFSVLFPGLPPDLMEKLGDIHSLVINGGTHLFLLLRLSALFRPLWFS